MTKFKDTKEKKQGGFGEIKIIETKKGKKAIKKIHK